MAAVAVIATKAWLVIFVESDEAEGLVVERPVLHQVVCYIVSSYNNVRHSFSFLHDKISQSRGLSPGDRFTFFTFNFIKLEFDRRSKYV